MKIAAIIPTLGERPELMPLISQLVHEGIEVITLARPDVHNIHTIWNEGVRLAQSWQAEYLAILNDDIKLPEGTLAAMRHAMESGGYACVGVDPGAKFGIADDHRVTPVTGTVGDLMTGVTTWCFMVRAQSWVDIDERYQWWWGVGDLFTKIVAAGGTVGRIEGLGIIHIGSGTAQKHHWTQEAKRADGRLWRETH